MATQCRACMNISASDYIKMSLIVENAEMNYFQCFSQVTQLFAVDTDELPGLICNSCAKDLLVAFEFIQTACQAEKIYRKHLTKRLLEQQEKQQQQQQAVLVAAEPLAIEILDFAEDDNMADAEFLELAECGTVATSENTAQSYEEVEILQLSDGENASVANTRTTNIAHIKEEEVDIDDVTFIDDTHDDIEAEDEGDDEIEAENDGDDDYAYLKENVDVSVEGHWNWHRNQRSYNCQICEKAFRCPNMLTKHVQLLHQQNAVMESIYFCQLCNNNYETETELLEHQQSAHVTNYNSDSIESTTLSTTANDESNNSKLSYECNFCQEAIAYDEIEAHLQNAHPQETCANQPFVCVDTEAEQNLLFKCDICSRSFEQQKDLEQHRQSHVKEHAHQCDLCHKRFASQCNLTRHLTLAHATEAQGQSTAAIGMLSNCHICQKQLLTKNLEKHLEMHARKMSNPNSQTSSNSTFLCSRCSREFRSLKSLQQHEKTHSTDKSTNLIYTCTDCDRSYYSAQLLEQHRRQTHKARDHVCEICGNAFKLKNQLVNHLKLHLEKNIPCPLCDKKYARTFDLDVHMRTHTGEQPFKCHLCERRFAIKVRLTYHLQKHFGVRHRCKECNAEFNSRQKLRAHNYKHTGMPYRCDLCAGHGFANRDVFKRHLNRVHHTYMSNEELTEMFKRNTGRNTKILPVEQHNAIILDDDATKQDNFYGEEDYVAMETEIVS